MNFFLPYLSCLLLVAPAIAKDSESNPYVPRISQCPSNLTYVRTADSLSPGETSFLKKRDEYTRHALIDWLGKSNLTDFDASSFLSNQTIRVALAYSGGGYRAMLCGAGQLAALDNRTTNATDPGHVGGLLQASTYLAGLSGGNWLVGSIVLNNFTTIQKLQADEKLWNFKHSMINPGGANIFSTFSYWDKIISDVEDKQDAGWNVSLTDIWGRGISYQIVNDSNGGEGYAYSQIRDHDAFQKGEMPFPVHVTDRRGIGEKIVNLNSSVFEFNPYEIGSWDPNVYHFADLKYLGTYADGGKVQNQTNCTTNYDNAGFLIGTSATLFNQFLLRINTTGITGEIKKLAEKILHEMAERSDDISIFNPSPFYNVEATDGKQKELLTLVDGGEDGENIPLYPVYQPQRDVDVIFAFDNSNDHEAWPAGKAMIKTYERQFDSQANGTHFPYVPDNYTFLYGGLTEQPTFFGCNITNLTSLYKSNVTNSSFETKDPVNIPPVIVYIANSEHSYASNKSTFKLSYSDEDRDAMIQNGYDVMSQNNGTLDSEWRSCLGCAIVLREQQRRGQSPTQQCQQCLQKYCWDGKIVTPNDKNVIARRDGKSNLVNGSKAAKQNESESGGSDGSDGSDDDDGKKKKKKKNIASGNLLSKQTALLAIVLAGATLFL